MQQILFHKEGMNHYMVIPCNNCIEENYTTYLFRCCKVPGMLGLEIRECNGKQSLYYHLEYRTTLQAIKGHLQFTEQRIRRMIFSIIHILKVSEEYLFDANGILWRLDCVFIEVDSGSLQFCYSPDRTEDGNTLQHFLIELAQLVDKKEEDSLMLVLRFYHLMTEEGCTLQDVFDFEKEYLGDISQEDSDAVAETDFWWEEESKMFCNDVINKESNYKKEKRRKENDEENKSVWVSLVRILFVIGIIVNLVLIGLLLCNRLSYDSIKYLLITMGFLIGSTILLMVLTKEESPEEMMKEYLEEQKDMQKTKAEIQKEEFVQASNLKQNSSHSNNIICNETTVLNQSYQEDILIETKKTDFVLEAMKKDKYPLLTIQKESTVVGSMDGICNYILKENGVSRMHAKLMKKSDGLFLLDLNSTNGTYRNGELLQSGEEYLLEEGDLVAFATCEFYVRLQ